MGMCGVGSFGSGQGQVWRLLKYGNGFYGSIKGERFLDWLHKKFSDTSVNEDNSFRNHIR